MAKSTFSEMARPGVCEVCGKNAPVVVCASAFGPVSFAYCEECLKAGLEPYRHMVNYVSEAGEYVSEAGEWPHEIAERYRGEIRRILKGLGKSEEEFATDVRTAIEVFSW